MPKIQVLDEQTIDQIAAGEVVERPSSVVKELVENAIDAKSTAITVEIREGGTSLIRITDNGCGIPADQIPLAFFRHATSKLRRVEDLLSIASLGFRGEALSSIASVAQVELITKTPESFVGSRYRIEGGEEIGLEEIGAPQGTTFLVRNLFYNTPARKKFLKAPGTEAGYISDMMERFALSHPEISFKFINNGQIRLHTTGNARLKDIIYHIYGRNIAANLLEIQAEYDEFSVRGYLGKPTISRGNRNYESYFINGRYIKSPIIAKAIEDGYRGFMMQHKYPFCVLSFTIDGSRVDVNVHPNKMELRFSDGEMLYQRLMTLVRDTLRGRELIADVDLTEQKRESTRCLPNQKAGAEPFEVRRRKLEQEGAEDNRIREGILYGESKKPDPAGGMQSGEQAGTATGSRVGEQTGVAASRAGVQARPAAGMQSGEQAGSAEENRPDAEKSILPGDVSSTRQKARESIPEKSAAEAPLAAQGISRETTVSGKEDLSEKSPALQENRQLSFADYDGEDTRLLAREALPKHRLIGQLFDTYWLVEFQDRFYLIDQHAAHEKILYERMMENYRKKEFSAQMISPPLLLSLTMQEEILLHRYLADFEGLGFCIESFGGKEYTVSSVPADLYGIDGQALLLELVDGLGGITEKDTPDIVAEKIASMSCKAAVKGNDHLSTAEANQLIADLLQLENPYFCPHGRPVIVSMTRYEIEKKFKRIV